MIRRLRTTLAVALLSLPLGAGAAETMHGMKHGTPASPADKAYIDSMARMHRDMDVTLTGDPDRDFVSMMLPHHEGAVAMARTELQFGKDPVLRKMAEEVIASQAKEIEMMKAWQARNAR